VLARHFGIDTPINTTEGKKTFVALAQSLLPSTSDSSTYNQAIMDFGAIQCTPALPNCVKCPLIETCEAFRSASVNQLPVKLKTIKVRERHLTYLYIRWQGKVAIHRRGVGDIWQGLWEPLVQETEKEVDIKGKVTILKRAVKHVLTHQVLLADFLLLEPEVQPQLPADYQWVPEESLDDYAVPRLVEHLFEAVRINDGKSY
jgi:A/G-specific adenine glycosylase